MFLINLTLIEMMSFSNQSVFYMLYFTKGFTVIKSKYLNHELVLI